VTRCWRCKPCRLGLAVVSGISMRPTLLPGDVLLVAWGAQPAVGKLVIIRSPDRPPAVKRVTFEVPEGWWVERDNPLTGADSWAFGAVPTADVMGVVACRLWPVIRRVR
jgi:hypothetical protein